MADTPWLNFHAFLEKVLLCLQDIGIPLSHKKFVTFLVDIKCASRIIFDTDANAAIKIIGFSRKSGSGILIADLPEWHFLSSWTEILGGPFFTVVVC